MRSFKVALFAIYALPICSAATTYNKKDACVNLVAGRTSGAPARAVVKADCQAIFKPVVVKEVVITVSKITSAFLATTTVTTRSDSGSFPKVKRQQEVPLPKITTAPDLTTEPGLLAARANLNLSKKRPTYASKVCRDLPAFAVACLCAGFDATTIRPTRTTTLIRTIPVTATVTTGFDYISYLRAYGQEFCTSFNHYQPFVDEVITTSFFNEPTTVTESTTLIQSSTVTIETVITTASVLGSPWRLRKRNLVDRHHELMRKDDTVPPVPTPPAIAGWQIGDIYSACLSVATGQLTSTITVEAHSDTRTETLTSTSIIELTATESTTISATSYPSPTQIVGSLTSAPAELSKDVCSCFTLPFDISQYNSGLSPAICVSVRGLLFFHTCNSNSRLLAFANDKAMVHTGQPEGIDYLILGDAPSRRARVRWYVGDAAYLGATYNFSVTLFEDAPGLIVIDYNQMYQNGATGVVLTAQDSPKNSIFYMYQNPVLVPGRRVTMDTRTNQLTVQ